MNKRQVDIVRRIVQNPKFYTVDTLAFLFHKSKRTIYHDLEMIRAFLEGKGVQGVDLVTQKELSLDAAEKIEQCVQNLTWQEHELAIEEREALLFLILAMAGTWMTLADISEEMRCSKSTLLKVIRAWRMQNGKQLVIEGDKAKGVFLRGDEYSIRKQVVDIYKKYPLMSRLFLRNIPESGNICEVQSRIHAVVVDAMMDERLFFTEMGLQCLEAYLLLVDRRKKRGYVLEVAQKEGLRYKVVAERIFSDLGKAQDVSEICFLAVLLESLPVVAHKRCFDDILHVQFLVSVFAEKVSRTLGVNLLQDTDFVSNMTYHMRAIMSEDGLSIEFENDEIRMYMEQHGHVVEAVGEACHMFEAYMGRELSALEKAYMALHISASMEKLETSHCDVRALLVCHSGIGMARLLKYKLENAFPLSFVDNISMYELSTYDFSHVDCVISTVPLPPLALPYLQVQVGLLHSDIASVHRMVGEVIKKKSSKKQDVNMARILSEFKTITEGYPGLLEKVTPIVRAYCEEKQEGLDLGLMELLKESRVMLDVEATTWEEAVGLSAGLLEREGLVAPHFKTEIVRAIHAYGPYIMIAPRVSLPHGGKEQGARRAGMSFVRLKRPVHFDDETFCDMFFCLSAPDKESHVKGMMRLIEVLQKEEWRECLRRESKGKDWIYYLKMFVNMLNVIKEGGYIDVNE